MRIGEIAEKTGLTISNIRFYEKKGLIGPDREEESKYRNYTEADLLRLKQIQLLRKMDFPIETIGSLLEEKISWEEALGRQVEALNKKQAEVQNSIDLCQKLLEDKAWQGSDPDLYLTYVKEEEAKGKRFGGLDDLLDDFSSYTQIDHFIGGRNAGWFLFPKLWMNRLAVILWGLFLVAMPVVAIVSDLVEDGSISTGMLIFGIVWLLALLFLLIGRGFPFKKKSR